MGWSHPWDRFSSPSLDAQFLSGPGRQFHHKFLDTHPQLRRRHSSTYFLLCLVAAPAKEFYVRNDAPDHEAVLTGSLQLHVRKVIRMVR